MGCASSTQQQPLTVSEMLVQVRRAVDEDSAALTGEDKKVVATIAKRVGVDLEEVDSSSTTPRAGTYQLKAGHLRETWKELLELYGHQTIGGRILEDLMELQPMAVVAFHNIPRDAQAAAIARMIDQVVDIERNAATIVPSLLSLGARHALYGLDASVLEDMKTATMQVIRDLAHEPMLEEEEAAWERTWTIVIDLMSHGLRSPTGVTNRDRYERESARTVRSLWHTILLKQTEAPPERRLMTRLMYKRIIASHPEMARFSNLTDFRTADRIMHLITDTIDKLAVGTDTSTTLRECGARHIAYNVTVEDMRMFEPSFLDTCADYLGDEFTVASRHLFSRFWEHLVAGLEVGMRSADEVDPASACAPKSGHIAIVFTDIEKSTRLWESQPAAMSAALDAHNLMLRQLIAEYGGYEVKTIGDSFMVAFETITDATLFACRIQTELMAQPSNPAFKMVSPTQASGPAKVWRSDTLRVRVGVAYSDQFNAQYDPVHRRVDYLGPAINLAARLESAANGGQVLLTGHAAAQLQKEQREASTNGGVAKSCGRDRPIHFQAPPEFIELFRTGDPGRSQNTESPPAKTSLLTDALVVMPFQIGACLRGVSDTVDLYTVSARSLAARQFHAAPLHKGKSQTELLASNSRRASFSVRSSHSAHNSDKTPTVLESGTATFPGVVLDDSEVK